MSRVVMIPCDDGTGNKLNIVQSDDGDIWVSVIDNEGRGHRKSVRICTSQGSGVKKMMIRWKLQEAINEAIKAGFEV